MRYWTPALGLAAGTALVFFAVGSPLLSKAGLAYNEALGAGPAIEFLVPAPAGETPPWPWWMVDPHQGSISTWALIPVFKIFGISMEALRATTLGIGAFSVFFTVLFAARRLGLYWAALLALALATSPGIILAAAFDAQVSMGMLLRAACIFAIGEAVRGRDRRGWLLAAGIAMGLGVWNKPTFLWLMIAAPPAAWILRRGPAGGAVKGSDASAVAAGFLVGIAPVVYFNFLYPLASFQRPPPNTESLLNHALNLHHWIAARFAMAFHALTGTGPYEYMSGRRPPAPWEAAALPAAGAAALAVLVRRSDWKSLREPGFWLLLAAGVFFIACLAPMPVKWHHFPLIATLLELSALTLCCGAFGAEPARGVGFSLGALALAASAGQFVFIQGFTKALDSAGGVDSYQHAGRDLASWLQDYQRKVPGAIFLCDDLLDAPLPVLTAARIRPSTLNGVTRSGKEPSRALEALADGRLIWLRRSPLSADFDLASLGRDEALASLEREMPDRILAVFRDAAGRPWATVHRAAPIGLPAITRAWTRAVAVRTAGGLAARGAAPAAARRGASPRIEWVTIPGGTFVLGAGARGADAQPPHAVTVPAFEIARTPVTNGQYKRCVEAGACSKPGCDALGDDYPAVCVDWDQARTYAEWAGGRLPSEAEWEYAARGAGRDLNYPWGPGGEACARSSIAGCGTRPEPVCSKPAGNTAQGLCDMLGDRWEWVQDYYHGSYDGAPVDGGAWETPADAPRVDHLSDWRFVARVARSAYRTYFDPNDRSGYVGFRPVKTD